MYFPSLEGTPDAFRCSDLYAATAGGGTFAGAGEVCSEVRDGVQVSRRCGPGLDCIPRLPRRRPRRPLRGAAGACATRAPSARSTPCLRCQPVTVRDREGETCVQGNGGAEVCSALDCVAGRCRRVGTGERGSPCFTTRFGVDNCRAGLACQSATQTCQPRAAAGATCTTSDECESRRCVADGTGPARVGDSGCGV